MIRPDEYEIYPEPLISLTREMEENILLDICRRIRQEGYITATAEIQISAMIDLGYSAQEIKQEISRITNLSEEIIGEMYEKAASESDRFEKEVYEKLDKKPIEYKDNPFLKSEVDRISRQTNEEFKNITRSLGFSIKQNGKTVFLPASRAYQHVLDRANLEIQSGAFDARTAIKRAVKELADSGLKTIDYASGRKESLEVAVRRATVTGLNQVSEKVTDWRIDEMQSPLVEVSAHGGARDKGSGFFNHKSWQGKVYYWKERDKWGRRDLAKKYPDFVSTTGYGNVAGLEGANCRHSKRVFIDGVSVREWTSDKLRNIDPPDFMWKGKKYTVYDATQYQRALEVKARKYERDLIAFEELGIGTDDKDYQNIAIWLRRVKGEYQAFSAKAHLRTQQERMQIYGWGKGQAARANSAAQKAQKMA